MSTFHTPSNVAAPAPVPASATNIVPAFTSPLLHCPSDSPSVKTLDALAKVEAQIVAKRLRRCERELAGLLRHRFGLVGDPDLIVALAPYANTRSIDEALAIWIGQQSSEPLVLLTEDVIESFATVLRHKLWRIQDDQGVIA